MAKMILTVDDDVRRKLERLEHDMPKVAEEVLQAGGAVITTRARRNLQGSIGRNLIAPKRSTGTLLKALGTSPAKLNRRGSYDVKIGFADPRAGGKITNAQLGNMLEYGMRRRRQPAKPFMRPAANSSENEARAAMQDKLDELVRSV